MALCLTLNLVSHYCEAIKKRKKIKYPGVWRFGLKPISKINYKIQNSALSVDSASTIYEGSGGVNEAFLGTGIRFHNFSIGFNTGYLFGEKTYDTRLVFNSSSDSSYYYKTHYGSSTHFGGIFLDFGAQYAIKLKKNSALALGIYGTLQNSYKGNKDDLLETYDYNGQNGTTTAY